MKKKPIIIFTTLSLLFFSFLVIASHSNDQNFTVELSREAKAQADKMDLNDLNHSTLVCEGRFCTYAIWKEREIDRDGNLEIYPLGKNHKIPFFRCTLYNQSDDNNDCIQYTNYNRTELSGMMNEDMTIYLEEFFQTSIRREAANDEGDHQVGKGSITINER